MAARSGILSTVAANAAVFAAQYAGIALLLVFAGIWLHIPDSHVWQLVFSLLLGALLVCGALALHTWSFRRLRESPPPPRRWVAWLVLAAFLVLLWILWMPADWISDHAPLWAPYWYSKLSRGARATSTYGRIQWTLEWFALLLRWWIVPSALLPFAMESVVRGTGGAAWRLGWRALLHWKYWLATGLAAAAGVWLVRSLVGWQPGHTPRQQVLSLVVRVLLAYTAGAAAWYVAQCAASARLASAELQDGSGRDPVL